MSLKAAFASALLASTLTILFSGSSQSATVVNGSFEDNNFGGADFITLNTGDSTSLAGWTVSQGSVDLISTYWAPQDGDFSIDMNGNEPGILTGSIVDLVVGKVYQLSFWMAGNTDDPNPINAIKLLGVFVANYNLLYSFDTTGKTHENPGWIEIKHRFVAENTIEALNFTFGPNAIGPYGPAIDNVSVAAVPLPAAAPLLLAALGGLGLMRRRRRT